MDQVEFSKKIDEIITKKPLSGIISIRSRDKVVYEKAFGYSDRGNKLENEMDTRFGIASGTKFLTALAIGKLIEADKLSLLSKLHECIPHQFPNYSPEVTIGNLLNHTSGIPDYYDEEKMTDFDHFALNVPTYELKNLEDYLPTFPDEPMKFSPGERFSYCNGGYILLGLVIEAITGVSYQEYVTREILEPIGMSRSGFFWLNKLPEKTALGYLGDATNWRTNIYNLPIVGGSDGGVFTTARDLSVLWKAFFDGQILSKELVEMYARPSVKADSEGENVYYGYGLWIHEGESNNREVYILGGDAGVSFRSTFNRAQHLQTTIISNTTNGVWEVLKDIDAALGDLRKPPV
ncbi:MAG: beta-lactamase family protein [Pleurocapsa sp. SU_196_0]|nr:beta-lactamase family protein [Pleurocapsa sp. SU_196_0]